MNKSSYVFMEQTTRLSCSVALNSNYVFCDKISSFAKYSSLCHLALELRQVSDLWRVLFSFVHSNKEALNKRSGLLYGADDETRTRDSLLGRQILYQLSYVRIKPIYNKPKTFSSLINHTNLQD